MKIWKKSLLFGVSIAALSHTFGWTPTFTKGLGEDTLKVDGIAIADHNDSITFPSPTFADWDGDGLEDMILGYWYSYSKGPNLGGGDGGKVRFLKNIGAKGDPIFTDMGNLEAGGLAITLEAA